MSRLDTQLQQILTHLKRGWTITPLQALQRYGAFRLAAQVFKLRQQGYDIRTEMVEQDGARFARYRLVDKP